MDKNEKLITVETQESKVQETTTKPPISNKKPRTKGTKFQKHSEPPHCWKTWQLQNLKTLARKNWFKLSGGFCSSVLRSTKAQKKRNRFWCCAKFPRLFWISASLSEEGQFWSTLSFCFFCHFGSFFYQTLKLKTIKLRQVSTKKRIPHEQFMPWWAS